MHSHEGKSLKSDEKLKHQPSESAYLNDKWIAASALQKAIRRGNSSIAKDAAQALAALSPPMLWRRIACTALEDIAPLDIDVVTTALSRTLTLTNLDTLIERLCEAVKDRSTDYLTSIIQYAPDLEGVRDKWPGDLQRPDYPWEIISGSDIEIRAMLAWHQAGTASVPSDSLAYRRGSPSQVFEGFIEAGIPEGLVRACADALRRLRNPLPLFYPLLWQDISNCVRQETTDTVPAAPELVHGIPLYALGGHTRMGKQAISKWAGRSAMAHSPEKLGVSATCWRKAAELGVFHVESAVIRPALRWDMRGPSPGNNLNMDPTLDDPFQWDVGGDLRLRAIEADFATIGFPLRAIPDFLEAVAASLSELDLIRTELIERHVQMLGRQRASLGANQ